MPRRVRWSSRNVMFAGDGKQTLPPGVAQCREPGNPEIRKLAFSSNIENSLRVSDVPCGQERHDNAEQAEEDESCSDNNFELTVGVFILVQARPAYRLRIPVSQACA